MKRRPLQESEATLNKVLTCIVAGLIAYVGIYQGSYRPLMKAWAIHGLEKKMAEARTLQDVRSSLQEMLDVKSYVGNQEGIAATLEYIKVLVPHFPKESEAIELVSYGESLATSKDDVRQMLGVANMYGVLYQAHPDYTEALAKREKWLLKVLTITPQSPVALYSLFDVYNAMGLGAAEERNQVAKTILTLWPGETRLEAYRYLTK